MTKFRYAFLMLAAAALPIGCMSTPLASNTATASLGNPMTLINIGAFNKNAMTVSIKYQDIVSGFKTKSGQQFLSSNVTYLAIDLVSHIVTNVAGDNYAGASALYSLYLRGPAWTTPTGTIVDAGTTGAFAFTNVPQGQYRFRVKASINNAGGPATAPGAGQEINKPDLFFTTNNGGWEVSDNFATVTNGVSVVSYSSGGSLTCTLALKDGVGDQVSSQVTVTNGASIGAIGAVDQ
jgi:hypothetical protein